VRRLVFSDLDGTLLDLETYSFDPALPAIQTLREQGVPLILCSSKTRAEMEYWRSRLDNDAPFIVENGGAIYIPRNYFPFRPEGSKPRDGYDVIEFGTPYKELVQTLKRASIESDCRTLGFHDMSVAEICLRTSLTVRQAELAKRREYDEPFDIIGSRAHRLLSAIKMLGYNWTQGDRLYHITGANDKALAVQRLTALYAGMHGSITTIGVGNGSNDANFLRSVDEPVIVDSHFAAALAKLVPGSIVTRSTGPCGWNEAIGDLFADPSVVQYQPAVFR
jgi:mannosyl-3-phosphoglycerate phosphatase family protein